MHRCRDALVLDTSVPTLYISSASEENDPNFFAICTEYIIHVLFSDETSASFSYADWRRSVAQQRTCVCFVFYTQPTGLFVLRPFYLVSSFRNVRTEVRRRGCDRCGCVLAENIWVDFLLYSGRQKQTDALCVGCSQPITTTILGLNVSCHWPTAAASVPAVCDVMWAVRRVEMPPKGPASQNQ